VAGILDTIYWRLDVEIVKPGIRLKEEGLSSTKKMVFPDGN